MHAKFHDCATFAKVRVFLAGTSLVRAYGGPAYSVSRLAVALAQAGVDVGLWAPDQSAATTPFLPAASAVQRLTGTEAVALDQFGKTDVLHDNGIWMAHNHKLAQLAARRGLPRMVSTRGMLEPWAVNHKRMKKRIAWMLYQQRDLTRARGLHATAETEADNLERLRLGIPLHVIPNGVDLPQTVTGHATNELRTALFLGRIYPVKGLPMLIEAWERVRPTGWVLKIAGPEESGHRTLLEKQVSATNLGGNISFLGELDGQAKGAALFSADLLVLPTHSESFGMAVAEALAHGLPVLTTTGAPWPMLEQCDCGWRVAPTVDGIAEGLRQATSSDAGTLRAMGDRGRKLVAMEYAWEKVANQFVSLYSSIA